MLLHGFPTSSYDWSKVRGVTSHSKSQDLQLLGMSRQHSRGGPCSRGELLISAGGATVLQDITSLLSLCEIQALSTSHSPENSHNNSLAFLGDGVAAYWGILTCCCFLGAGMFSGLVGRSTSIHGCSSLQMFPFSAPTGCFSNAFLLFPDLGRADPALPPGDCPGFPWVWI